MLYDDYKGICIAEMTDHKDWVQGVTWDPLNKFIATQSKDRTMSIYSVEILIDGGLRTALVSKNVKLLSEKPSPTAASPSRETSPSISTSPTAAAAAAKIKTQDKLTSTQLLYGDEETTPFFRRLAFSPDGSLLVTPAGIHDDSNASSALASTSKRLQASDSGDTPNGTMSSTPTTAVKEIKRKAGMSNGKVNGAASAGGVNGKKKGPNPTVYLYARGQLANESPVAHLPGHKTTSVVVRFCPVLWERRIKSGRDKGKGKGKGKEETSHIEDGEMQVDGEEHSSAEMSQVSAIQLDSPSEGINEGMEGPSNFRLAKRSIYAVATHETILIYDTQQASPICMFGSLHFAAFTDLAWCIHHGCFVGLC